MLLPVWGAKSVSGILFLTIENAEIVYKPIYIFTIFSGYNSQIGKILDENSRGGQKQESIIFQEKNA